MRIDKDTRNNLANLSKDTGIGMSELVRTMVNATYKKHLKRVASNDSNVET